MAQPKKTASRYRLDASIGAAREAMQALRGRAGAGSRTAAGRAELSRARQLGGQRSSRGVPPGSSRAG